MGIRCQLWSWALFTAESLWEIPPIYWGSSCAQCVPENLKIKGCSMFGVNHFMCQIEEEIKYSLINQQKTKNVTAEISAVWLKDTGCDRKDLPPPLQEEIWTKWPNRSIPPFTFMTLKHLHSHGPLPYLGLVTAGLQSPLLLTQWIP